MFPLTSNLELQGLYFQREALNNFHFTELNQAKPNVKQTVPPCDPIKIKMKATEIQRAASSFDRYFIGKKKSWSSLTFEIEWLMEEIKSKRP